MTHEIRPRVRPMHRYLKLVVCRFFYNEGALFFYDCRENLSLHRYFTIHNYDSNVPLLFLFFFKQTN